MAKNLCPLFRQPCVEHDCRWYVQLLGAHPQTGEQLSKYGCAVEFTPILLIENANQVRQHAAAVETMRNEARRDTTDAIGAAMEIARAAMPPRVVNDLQELRPPRPGFFRRLLGKAS